VNPLPLQVSAPERARIAEVDRLAALGGEGVPRLIEQLAEPSWAVRRVVISALARLGPVSAGPLCQVLRSGRDSEARLAAAVDALSLARGDIDALVLDLASHGERPAVVADAAAVLGRRRSARATPTLARLTQHADDNVAVAAIEALGRIGGAAAVDSLVATVRRRDFFRTFPALDVLGRSGQEAAVETLSALLDDPLYAPEAARALGHTGLERSIGHLLPLLGRGGETLARVSAVALCELDDRLRQRVGGASPVEVTLAARRLDAAVVSHLARSVAGATQEEQAALCRVLGYLDSDAATAALLELIDVAPQAVAAALQRSGGNPRLRQAVRDGASAHRLVLLPLLRSVPGAAADAVRCLDDPDPAVRAMACDILAREGEVSALPALFERLGDSDPGVVQAAVGALQALGTSETKARAVEAARSAQPRVRHAALRLLGYFGFPDTLPVLLEAVRGDDERAREIALGGVALIDRPEALEALVAAASHPQPKTRAAAVRALGNCPVEPRTRAVLRAALHDPDAWVRYYAVQALGRRREEDAVEALLPLLEDPAGQLHVAVIDALAHLTGEAASSALRSAARSADPDVRRAAFLGLGASQRAEALPLLIEAAGSPDQATRVAAAAALGTFNRPQVVPLLVQLAGDPDGDVASSAVGFLAERSGVTATLALIRLLGDVRHTDRIARALKEPRAGRVSALVAALQGADSVLAPLLASILRGHADSEAALVATLHRGGTAARQAAAAALAGMGSAEVHEALEYAAIHDPDPEVQRLATVVLSQP